MINGKSIRQATKPLDADKKGLKYGLIYCSDCGIQILQFPKWHDPKSKRHCQRCFERRYFGDIE